MPKKIFLFFMGTNDSGTIPAFVKKCKKLPDLKKSNAQ